jgi:hypothetical protein
MTELRPVSFRKGRASAPRLSAPRAPGRHDERFWTAEENAILRQYFPAGGVPAAGAHLPNRSRSAIYGQAAKLGLKRTGRAVRNDIAAPPDIDEQLRARWPELQGRGAVAALAEYLGVPRWWLSQRARKLGLTVAHKKEPRWTAAEDALMRRAPLHDLDRCAEMFAEHGFRRSPTAIGVRAKRIDLSRRASRTTLSGTQVARILGLDSKTVTAWCVAGNLKARRRGTNRLPQQGGDVWDVEPHDLRAFIIENIARIDIRKVEKVEFVDLLTRVCNETERDVDDARRYRWLRSRDLDVIGRGGIFIGVTPDNLAINLEDADRRIDEAMAMEKRS